MLSLVVVLLTATPGQSSLLSPAGPELRPSARLLAQAAPSAQVSPESAPGSSAPPLVTAPPEERIRDLTLRINELNERIRSINTDWPVSSLVMSYSGYILTPLLLVGVPILLVGLAFGEEGAGLAVVGGAITGVGVVGGVLLVVGLVTGISDSDAAKTEKQHLTYQRSLLEKELKELKRRADPGSTWRLGPDRPLRTVTVAAIAF
jgi:hypothetical protein